MNSASEKEIINKQSKQIEPQSSVHKLIFSWWVHGGEPGPDYKSDLIEFYKKGGEIRVIYSHVLFNFDSFPHSKIERFEKTIEDEKSETVLHLVNESYLFKKLFIEEKVLDVGGIMKETWEMEQKEKNLTKTFYEPFPLSLNNVRNYLKSLIPDVVENGQKVEN